VENMNAEREEYVEKYAGSVRSASSYSATKLSDTYRMNLVQYQANKRTPFPPASTRACNETLRSKVKVNIFHRK
jgi:hypothetical protein